MTSLLVAVMVPSYVGPLRTHAPLAGSSVIMSVLSFASSHWSARK